MTESLPARRADRGQLPTPAIEAAVAVVLVLAVTAGFALGLPAAPTREPQLDAYASDVATLLADEPPRHRGGTRLTEVLASESAFERERAGLERRVDRLLADNLMFRIETPYGAAGREKPRGVASGTATVTTIRGTVTIRVWYV